MSNKEDPWAAAAEAQEQSEGEAIASKMQELNTRDKGGDTFGGFGRPGSAGHFTFSNTSSPSSFGSAAKTTGSSFGGGGGGFGSGGGGNDKGFGATFGGFGGGPGGRGRGRGIGDFGGSGGGGLGSQGGFGQGGSRGGFGNSNSGGAGGAFGSSQQGSEGQARGGFGGGQQRSNFGRSDRWEHDDRTDNVQAGSSNFGSAQSNWGSSQQQTSRRNEQQFGPRGGFGGGQNRPAAAALEEDWDTPPASAASQAAESTPEDLDEKWAKKKTTGSTSPNRSRFRPPQFAGGATDRRPAAGSDTGFGAGAGTGGFGGGDARGGFGGGGARGGAGGESARSGGFGGGDARGGFGAKTGTTGFDATPGTRGFGASSQQQNQQSSAFGQQRQQFSSTVDSASTNKPLPEQKNRVIPPEEDWDIPSPQTNPPRQVKQEDDWGMPLTQTNPTAQANLKLQLDSRGAPSQFQTGNPPFGAKEETGPKSPGEQEFERQKKTGFGWQNNKEHARPSPSGQSVFSGQSIPLDNSGEDEKDVKAETSLLNKILHEKLVEVRDADVKVNIEKVQEDPSSPLFSVKNFDELHLKPELVKAVADMGFNQPSKIQESALPVLLAHPPQNMIAQSQSGTGKTAAFALTMLMRVDVTKKYPQCLCLAPTYELALQIGDVVKKMGKYMPECKVVFAVRGERVQRGQQIEEQIIIGTPGTTLDWALKFRAFDCSKIKVFVLDEADVMISQQGHQDQSIRIEKAMPKDDCQRLLFSATYDEPVIEFAERIITEPIVITVRREEQTLDNIRQFYVESANREDKYRALTNLYGALTIGQCMIFCATRNSASWLAGQLTQDGHMVAILSGALDITQRADVIQRFKKGHEKVLITTNVSARGIDVAQVSIVINYDMPITVDKRPDYETYLHRIGRTGRFGKAGIAINFVDSSWSMNIMKDIENHFGKEIKMLDTEDQDQLERIEEGKE